MSKTIHSITYGTKEIEFELELTMVKNLSITVDADLNITVKAPENQTLEKILERVKRRASWILKQKAYFNSLPPPLPEREYVAGETHYYLGRQYRLKVIQSDKEEVKLDRSYIYIYTKAKEDMERNKTLLTKWYRKKIVKKFPERLKMCFQKIKKYGIVSMPEIKIRKMKKRWGSCTGQRNILLNPELIKTPASCIDYVITHELCHLKYHNHTNKFFLLLSQVMPDWQERKKKLEQIALEKLDIKQ